jgi:hypothetical protein
MPELRGNVDRIETRGDQPRGERVPKVMEFALADASTPASRLEDLKADVVMPEPAL